MGLTRPPLNTHHDIPSLILGSVAPATCRSRDLDRPHPGSDQWTENKAPQSIFRRYRTPVFLLGSPGKTYRMEIDYPGAEPAFAPDASPE